jgi:hypothetical protein
MSTDSETFRIARGYSESFDSKDWDRLRNEVLAPDVEAFSHSAQRLQHGPEEIIASLRKPRGAVVDTRIELYNAVVDGDQAVLELRLKGTAYGDPNDPNATPNYDLEGRPVTIATCHVYKVKDGKIWRIVTYSHRTFHYDKAE